MPAKHTFSHTFVGVVINWVIFQPFHALSTYAGWMWVCRLQSYTTWTSSKMMVLENMCPNPLYCCLNQILCINLRGHSSLIGIFANTCRISILPYTLVPPGNSVFTRLSVGLELKGHSPVFSLNLSGAWSPQGESDSPSHPSLMFLFAQLINPPTPIHLLPSTPSAPLWNWYQYASLFSHQKFTSLPPVLD